MTGEPRQSLTVIVDVGDAEACAATLGQSRLALEAAFAQLPGVHTACLALLPALPGAPESVLLFECSFEGAMLTLIEALLRLAGSEFCRIFGHSAGFPETAETRAVSEFLSARACRATACADSESPPVSVDFWQRARAFVAARRYWPTKAARITPDASELERRRGAVGMQDWQPGVPLLHVARLPDDTRSRARVRRALRALELAQPPLERAARFMIHGQRLLFLAYPAQQAQLWSERASLTALSSLTRVWADSPELGGSPWSPHKRRARHLERFLLDGRVPVAAWFNSHAQPRAV
jgi:hypothetical protein